MNMSTLSQTAAPLTDEQQERALYPIREVSRLTGVNPITLRAWERRYDLLEPIRTESGHRLYSIEHIRLLQRVVQLVNEEGIPIRQVKPLLEAEMEKAANEPNAENPKLEIPERFATLQHAIAHADRNKLQQCLDSMLADLPFSVAAKLLIEHMDTFKQLAQDHSVGTLLFNSLLAQRINMQLYHLQKHFNPNKPLLLVQNAQDTQPCWVAGLVAHFLAEQGYNLITLNQVIAPNDMVTALKQLHCTGLCLVDPNEDQAGLKDWQPWLQKHTTLNTWFFGCEQLQAQQEDLQNTILRAKNDWFKPLR